MKALRFSTGGLALTDVETPRVSSDDDVLVRVEATGVCGTDIQILQGRLSAKLDVVLGHESAGVVIDVGAGVSHVTAGDPVAIDPTYFCGSCRTCTRGAPNYCEEKLERESGVSTDGAFAEYYLAESRFVHRLPTSMALELATLTEPLSCVLTGLARTRICRGQRVIVIGAGPIGMLVGLVAETMGATVHFVERDAGRIEVARTLFGDRVLESLHHLPPSEPFDLGIDTVGSMVGQLLPHLGCGGQLLILGIDRDHSEPLSPSYLVGHGIDLIASCDNVGSYPAALDLLASEPRFRQVITRRFKLIDYREAFRCLGLDLTTGQRGRCSEGKVILAP